MASRRRPPNLVAVELTSYFLRADSVLGMSSSFMPLVGLAMGGFGGTSDPERRVNDRRFGWPEEGGETEIATVRRVRDALLALPPRGAGEPSWYDVLYATYGSIPWTEIIDEDRGTGYVELHVAKYIEPRLLGVALLVPEVRRGLAADRKVAAAKAKPGKLVTARSENLDKPFQNEELFYEGKTVDAYRVGRTDPVADDPTFRGPGPWILDLCRMANLPTALAESKAKIPKGARKTADEKAAAAVARLGLIQGQALQLLAAAEGAYRTARFPFAGDALGAETLSPEDASGEAPRPRPPRRRGPNRPKDLPIGGAR
jgi:hypothetical protein